MEDSQKTLESMSQAIWYNQWTLKKFEKYLKGDILEVGCGIGNFTKYLKKYGRVWAIDIKKDYVKQTKKVLGDNAGLGDIEKGEYFFKNNSFDTIICLNVLEHIRDDNRALRNLMNLLDGYLILLVPAHAFLYGEIDRSIGHFRRYDKNQLQKNITNLGLEIVKVLELNFLGALGWWISGKILKNNRVSANKIQIFNLFAPLFLYMENILEPPFGTSILLIARKRK